MHDYFDDYAKTGRGRKYVIPGLMEGYFIQQEYYKLMTKSHPVYASVYANEYERMLFPEDLSNSVFQLDTLNTLNSKAFELYNQLRLCQSRYEISGFYARKKALCNKELKEGIPWLYNNVANYIQMLGEANLDLSQRAFTWEDRSQHLMETYLRDDLRDKYFTEFALNKQNSDKCC